MKKLTLWCYFSLLALATAGQGYGPGDQEWGFISVRPGAHIFYWLYKVTNFDVSYTEKPLIIWLQGGPFAPSSGEGNLLMSGPIDIYTNETRSYTWTNDYNMLYIDHPLGTGYSYSDGGDFVSNSAMAAEDFVQCIKGFMEEYPEFQTVPLFVNGESYGGKWAAIFTRVLYEEIENNQVVANLKGASLNYPAVNLVESNKKLAEYFYQTGLVDGPGKAVVQSQVDYTTQLFEDGDYVGAYNSFFDALWPADNLSFSVIDINTDEIMLAAGVRSMMDNFVSPVLGISRPFGYQTNIARPYLTDTVLDAMDDITNLINNPSLKIALTVGQLDYLINAVGIHDWVSNMIWDTKEQWDSAPRKSMYIDEVREGYEKKHGNFAFYWMNNAGHRIPNHNPKASAQILEWLTS